MIRFEFDAASFPRPEEGGTAFSFVPVLLQVAGIDLVADDADADGATVAHGLGLPLPEVALWGLIALHHAARSSHSAYELNEHGTALMFRMSGDNVLVHSLRRERTVQVPYARLLAAWEDFDRRARRFLIETFGDLNAYAWWNLSMDRWLHGRMDLARASATTASMRFFETYQHCLDHVDAVEA